MATNYSKVYGGDGGKSNARRAARAAGIDPELVTACAGGFHYPLPAPKPAEPASWHKGKGGFAKAQAAAEAQAKKSGLKAGAFRLVVSFVHGEPEYGFIPAHAPSNYANATGTEKPQPQERPAKAAKTAKGKGDKKPRAKNGEGQNKQQQVRDMILRPEGATMPEITQATGWLPHTARARISGIVEAEGLAIERTRLLGVTTYKATRKKAKAA